MIRWSYAHQEARKGLWENCARNRVRFERRIKIFEKIITPILDCGHRKRIVKKRFETNVPKEKKIYKFCTCI